MVPETFANFFLASAGAGGALIGLLFVAISIAPERTVTASASMVRRATASSAFTALINAFFISLTALLPGANLGYSALVFGLIGVSSSGQLGVRLLREWHGWKDVLRRTVLVIASVVVYGLEIFYSIKAIIAPYTVDDIYSLTTLLLVVYSIGLIRAWELLGAQRSGLFGWLSPLHDDEEGSSKSA